jgi:hypothetical protein
MIHSATDALTAQPEAPAALPNLLGAAVARAGHPSRSAA